MYYIFQRSYFIYKNYFLFYYQVIISVFDVYVYLKVYCFVFSCLGALLRRVRVILIAKSWEEASLEIDRAQYPRSYELSARLSRKDEKQKIKEKDSKIFDWRKRLFFLDTKKKVFLFILPLFPTKLWTHIPSLSLSFTFCFNVRIVHWGVIEQDTICSSQIPKTSIQDKNKKKIKFFCFENAYVCLRQKTFQERI